MKKKKTLEEFMTPYPWKKRILLPLVTVGLLYTGCNTYFNRNPLEPVPLTRLPSLVLDEITMRVCRIYNTVCNNLDDLEYVMPRKHAELIYQIKEKQQRENNKKIEQD